MKLKSFKINCYKSAFDIGDCEVDESITVLAGKNESGKTNILEALSKLNPGNTFTSNERTLGQDEAPSLSAIFEIDEQEIQEIVEDLKEKYSITVTTEQLNGLKRQNIIEITKRKDTRYYGGDNWDSIKRIALKPKKDLITTLENVIKKFLRNKIEIITTDEEKLKEEDAKEEFTKKYTKILKNIKTNLPQIDEQDPTLKEEVAEIENKYENTENSLDLKSILNVYSERLPKIILFKSFDEEKLKDSLPLSEAKENQFVKDLGEMNSEFDIEEIESNKDDEYWIQNFEEKFSASLSDDFMDYWDHEGKDKISKVDIKVRIANNKITFFVSNPRTKQQFFTTQRSKGFQWFLSFYTRINSTSMKKNNAIILIDEPGLFLHAKSQSSVLKVLNQLGKSNQIIYATHSPYLIEIDKLQRIRLVESDQDGRTHITKKFYDTKNEDTLTPILTAIGHNIFNGITFDEKKNNVVVEGISDYLIIHAMAKLLKYDLPKNLYFIPMRGADSILKYVPFFIAWNLKFLILLDNDGKGLEIRKHLLNEWLVEAEQILNISEVKNQSIEDLFTHKEYFELLLNKTVYENDKGISGQLNSSQKVLAAKELMNRTKIGDIQLSNDTLDKFNKIFDIICSYFK